MQTQVKFCMENAKTNALIRLVYQNDDNPSFTRECKEDEEITVTENAIKTESQSKKIKLRAGEKLKRDEALKLMLIISADPIAESIAEHIAGSKMNL